MQLSYIYHSGFLLAGTGSAILLDYYRDTSDGLVERFLQSWKGRLYVLSSHFHADHFNPEVLRWREKQPEVVYLFSKDILKRRKATGQDARYLCPGDGYDDGVLRVRAFGSTDVGVSFYMEWEGLRLFHAGDLNNWHWSDESTPEEIRQAEGAYRHELKLLQAAVSELDVAMFPVDPRIGSDFARGARQFLEAVRVHCFVPMHYWERPEEAATFAPVAESLGARFILAPYQFEL